MKDTNYVKMFKTKGGAIRRLFKFLSWHENNNVNKFII
ncbi:hypothetical protein HYO65_gp125 [Tenacibaculum phage PTm1]|uniref:Uncharacterized protein n=2 Tax=Shirahamavirus PTm1 TaxID=2846435 RepID=A0A5S9HXS1_9CAUD|nr:hypothetical protein HYO65_gp125 [Tenacibaculum phage PTm1]BBI90517.1 hypothetical protein [Tenacibaculum phage PTm1]BBI90825.1 hypothetical protein [Tenacibaculum phage PTm5]